MVKHRGEELKIKERIMTAFKDLSYTKGFYRVTMDEVAAKAGVSKRTIYRYFTSKDEIIETVLEYFLQSVSQRIDELSTQKDSPADILKEIVAVFRTEVSGFINPLVLQDLQQHYPYLWERIEAFRYKKLQNIISIILAEKNGKYTRKLDPRIATAAMIASIQAVVNPDFILKNNLTADETISQLIDLFEYGIIKSN